MPRHRGQSAGDGRKVLVGGAFEENVSCRQKEAFEHQNKVDVHWMNERMLTWSSLASARVDRSPFKPLLLASSHDVENFTTSSQLWKHTSDRTWLERGAFMFRQDYRSSFQRPLIRLSRSGPGFGHHR